jgi:hypothetical protein
MRSFGLMLLAWGTAAGAAVLAQPEVNVPRAVACAVCISIGAVLTGEGPQR